jgi:hypothetical protein
MILINNENYCFMTFTLNSRFIRVFTATVAATCFCTLGWAAPDPPEFEHFTANVQSTWVWQKHPGFSAPYSGFSSLNPNSEIGYTLTGTAFLGARPWKGTEFFLDPEVTQGNPFSGLRGLGGMTNGEAQKAGSSDPIAYWARAFIRQTIGFGGGTVEREASFNQFAESVDKRRLVFTGGVYAITDIFDQNAFAHDPRSQFMNWSMMDYAAWDSPADARGYTRGVALEYYHDAWAFRIGRNLLPVESNGQQLNGDFSNSYSDNAEIEHAHEIFGQPGRLRVLGFRNVAKFGNFNDALSYARQFGGTPDVGNVRKEQSKYGFGVSLEQNVTDSVGVFARYSWNNGVTEGYSFTDVNDAALVGVSVKGTPWARPDDVLGLAYASNGISGANREYLSAGGNNFFCGDGKLNYQREGIFEIYYNVKIHKSLWATADYQRIQNPCFNSDRGPVNVYSVRLHLEF